MGSELMRLSHYKCQINSKMVWIFNSYEKSGSKRVWYAPRGEKLCELCIFPPRKEQQYIVILSVGFNDIK